MKVIASELVRLAKAVMRKEMVFTSPDSSGKVNVVHYEVSRFLDTVRKNEDLETFVNRTDKGDETRLEVGISDHESVDAIVREVVGLAEKIAKKHDIKMRD